MLLVGYFYTKLPCTSIGHIESFCCPPMVGHDHAEQLQDTHKLVIFKGKCCWVINHIFIIEPRDTGTATGYG